MHRVVIRQPVVAPRRAAFAFLSLEREIAPYADGTISVPAGDPAAPARVESLFVKTVIRIGDTNHVEVPSLRLRSDGEFDEAIARRQRAGWDVPAVHRSPE
jgi:hypothetical protein